MRAALPPEIRHAIRVPTYHSLFAARGYPPGIDRTTDALTAIVSALQHTDLPLPLARALFTIAAFATEAGRADIYLAAEALAYPARWPDAASPADLIASLLALAATDHAVAELLEAAQILRDRAFRPRTTQVYIGLRGVDADIGEPTQYTPALRTAVAALSARRDFGDVVSIDAHARAGTLSWEIVHEDRTQTHLVAAGSGQSVQPRATRAIPKKGAAAAKPPPHLTPPAHLTATTHRPLRSHLLTYERASRSLTITTDCAELVTPLAEIAGTIFFNNARHFLDEQALALWSLQELGPAALSVPELAAKLGVTAVGGTWHSGKNHSMTPRGDDFFKPLARYKIRIEGGRLDQITLRAKLTSPAGGPAQCDVALCPPHQLTISEPELAAPVREFLDAAKITSPEPRKRDFFSDQPWILSAEEWIAREGDAGFAALVDAGVLAANPSNRSITPPSHPHAGRTATAYRLRGTKFLAVSRDATIAPFVVDEKDLVVYALRFPKLASQIAAALGLDGAAQDLDDDGVLLCGRRALGTTHVLVFLLTRPIRPATVERLRDAAEHGHALLVTPEGRMQQHGLRQIAMPKLAGSWQSLLGPIVRALRLEALVDTIMYAPTDARVVLHRATMRVWIDGHLCTSLTELHCKLIEILATHPGQAVHTKDVGEHLAGKAQTLDTSRRAIESFVAAVTKSFKASKRKPPKDLDAFITKPRHAHYLLSVPAFVD